MHSSRSARIKLFPFLCLVGIASLAQGQDQFDAAPTPPVLTASPPADDFADYFADDSPFQLASLLQQPSTQPSLATATPQTRPAPRSRPLSNVPNMFGDAPSTTINGTVNTDATPFVAEVAASFPTPGFGGISAKLAENDRPIPTDRVFFSYHHSHNAFTFSSDLQRSQQHFDRYTVGFEKTFFEGWNSIELRAPFHGTLNPQVDSFGLDAGNVGNLAIVLKHLLYYSDSLAIGAGAALDVPTAPDVSMNLAFSSIVFQNQAVRILPFVGFNYAPGDSLWGWGDGFFSTGIMQLNVAANGNTIEDRSTQGTLVDTLGILNDQTLLFLDLNAGYWLYRDPYAPRWTGLAVVGELHYTTALQDSDFVSASNPSRYGTLTFGTPGGRYDVLNATIGLDALMFDLSSFRVAGAFPVKEDERSRMFDAEVQFQFNRRF